MNLFNQINYKRIITKRGGDSSLKQITILNLANQHIILLHFFYNQNSWNEIIILNLTALKRNSNSIEKKANNMINTSRHKFHIPVMGLAFSVDTPIKVAHYGIDSVISIMDDDLTEKMREVHSRKSGIAFEKISTKEDDYRAKRITAYLNLVDKIVKQNFESLKNSFGEKDGEFEKYIDMLPDNSELKIRYKDAAANNNLESIREWVLSNIKPGSIDVNIMTKVDGAVYHKNQKLPTKFNLAHSSLRGFANSTLESSVVLSAGMNPRLYSYFEEFKDFYPDENGKLKKKLVLKVSDYRSAMIQGKFLAKKGLWISEYRIESGLNCGGHAFASDGYLMGPILAEFKKNRESLKAANHQIYSEALERKKIDFNGTPHEQIITAQGGVGTNEEQNFLFEEYDINSVGWGTPFLLVPEATNVDEKTLSLLSSARENDLFLSRISPLGVPFNSLKGSTKEIEKFENALNGKPGSPCPKKYLQSNTEFSEVPICTASSKYQNQKIEELKTHDLSPEEYDKQYNKIIDKACLCVGLATSALKNNNAASKIDGDNVLICPGPNLAYFSSILSLKEMVDHIYGRGQVLSDKIRPNMFTKELKLYLNYLKEEIAEVIDTPSVNTLKYYEAFRSNLSDGINYYEQLFSNTTFLSEGTKQKTLNELSDLRKEFELITEQMILMELLSDHDKELSVSLSATN